MKDLLADPRVVPLLDPLDLVFVLLEEAYHLYDVPRQNHVQKELDPVEPVVHELDKHELAVGLYLGCDGLDVLYPTGVEDVVVNVLVLQADVHLPQLLYQPVHVDIVGYIVLFQGYRHIRSFVQRVVSVFDDFHETLPLQKIERFHFNP